MTAAFSLLLHGKLCWIGGEMLDCEICMAVALNEDGT
jgi:hypothetical protein